MENMPFVTVNAGATGEEIIALEKRFHFQLPQDLKALFEKYTDCIREFQTVTDCLIFQNSFKLGARIAFEVMAEP